MKLSFDQICAATTGAVNITREKDGLIYFHRMHPAQLDAAMARHENYYIRGRSNTGVKLTFRTDSTSLFLDLSASRGTMSYFAADILVDGKLIGSVDNFTQFEPLPQFHTQLQYPFGDFSGRFDLGEGEKTAECLDILSKSVVLVSLMTVHNDWRHMGMTVDWKEAPVQLDAAFGAVNAVQEMLFYWQEKEISVLPALPERLCAGSFRGMAFPGGTADAEWKEDGSVLVTIHAERDIASELLVKGVHAGAIALSAGETGTWTIKA